jgi:hypothetical protein
MTLHDHIGLADTTSKTAIILKKNDKVLISTAGPANLFGIIWTAQKHGLSIVNTLH